MYLKLFMFVAQTYFLGRNTEKQRINVKLVVDAELQDALDRFTVEAVKSLLLRLQERDAALPVV